MTRIVVPALLLLAMTGVASAKTVVIPVEDMEPETDPSAARDHEHVDVEIGVAHIQQVDGLTLGAAQISVTPRLSQHAGVRFAMGVGLVGAASGGIGSIGGVTDFTVGVPVFVSRPFDGAYVEPSVSLGIGGVTEAVHAGWMLKAEGGATASLAVGVEHGWLGEDVALSGELRVGYAF